MQEHEEEGEAFSGQEEIPCSKCHKMIPLTAISIFE
jgi:hypothetical protein